MKYNKSEIMKRAWQRFRSANNRASFATCLRDSWQIAKNEAQREAFTGKRPVTFMGYSFNFWKGGENRRIYINGTRTYGAYIDLKSMKPVLNRKCIGVLDIVVDKFLSKYEIAC